MKIIQLINSLQRGGGAEKFVCDLVLAQSKIDGVEVKIVNIMTPKNLDFIDICKKNNIEIYNINGCKYSVKTITRLKSIIELEKPDVVHVHLFPALYYASIVKKLSKYKFKLLYTEHSTTNRRMRSKFFKYLDSFIYSSYDRIIAISEQVSKSISIHMPEIVPIIINNGIDIDCINKVKPKNIRKDLGLNSDVFLLTMVARFCEIKDYATVIKALKLLPDNIHLVCIGDGPTLGENVLLVKNLFLTNRVHFLGLRKDVYAILKMSDAFVLSSHHEGFSIFMLEAMACGKPFIASSVPGIKDLVSNIAALFEYKNEKELAKVIEDIVSNNKIYEDLSAKSLSFASKYDINKIAGKYLNAYLAI